MKYHKRLSYLLIAGMALLVQPAAALVLTIDVDGDGSVDATDVQLCINKALGLVIVGNADLNGDDVVDAIDVQVIINAVLGILPDSDGDGLSDIIEIQYDGDPDYHPYPAGGDLDAENPDTDSDGVPDGIEIYLGTDPLDPGDAPADSDGDGLYDPIEDEYGTNPNEADTDGDGLSDGDEVYTHGTDPTSADTDSDGLNDSDEVNTYGTDPLDSDSDDDGLSDSDEVNTHFTGPTDPDTDSDGLSDGDEVNVYMTEPQTADTDSDGLSDGDEVNMYGTNPLDDDSDDDGLIDGDEIYSYATDPTIPDTDGDGLTDGDEINVYWTSPFMADTDLDQLPDGWEVSYGLNPISGAGDDGTTGNPDGDAFTNLEEYQNGTDPTVIDSGQPPEDFSGTWTGLFESTDSTIYPNDALPYGYLIAAIEQTGSQVTVSFPVGNGGFTGTVSGDTLTADGTFWMGDPGSVTLTISGTQISGMYTAGAGSTIDQGTLDLTLTSGPAAQIQAGDWYGTLEDKYESSDRPVHAVFFTSIEVPAVSQLVLNVEYQDSEDPGRVYQLPGRIAGNVFMAMFQQGDDITCFSGVIENDSHITYSYDSRWIDDDNNEFSWGEIEQWVSPGALVDMNGAWLFTPLFVYPDIHDGGTTAVTLTQTGTQLTMQVPGENILLSGEVRGNTFVMIGPNGSDEPMRFDGVLDSGQLSGTHGTDEDDGWTWGTYTAQQDGLPPEDFSGTWTGTYETTSSDAYPGSAMPHGYLIATIDQTGSQVTVTFPVGSGGLTGTVSGDALTATGSFWTGGPASVSLTISGTQLTGTYETGTVGNIDQGTLDLTLTSGPPAQIQAGPWYGTIEDRYVSDGSIYGVFFSSIEIPSGSQLVINIELDEPGDPGIVSPMPGEIAGNVFMCGQGGAGWFEYLTGIIESNDHVSGTWQEVWEGDFFGWGEFEQRLSPGAQVDLNGTWRVNTQDVYADDPQSGTVDITVTQTGTSLTMLIEGEGTLLSGEIRGDMFVVMGQDGDGDSMRIDGALEGSRLSGTYEGQDVSDWDDWWWGTYTGQRR